MLGHLLGIWESGDASETGAILVYYEVAYEPTSLALVRVLVYCIVLITNTRTIYEYYSMSTT